MSDKERLEEIYDEDENEIIELIDDDGNQLKFKILDVLKYKGEKYGSAMFGAEKLKIRVFDCGGARRRIHRKRRCNIPS